MGMLMWIYLKHRYGENAADAIYVHLTTVSLLVVAVLVIGVFLATWID